MNEILQYLKTQGESHDTLIAEATENTLTHTRNHLIELVSIKEIMVCYRTLPTPSDDPTS